MRDFQTKHGTFSLLLCPLFCFISLNSRIRRNRRNGINGSTDSETAFALFLEHLLLGNARGAEADAAFRDDKDAEPEAIRDAMRHVFSTIQELQDESGVLDDDFSSSMNFCVTDGKTTVASRYRRPHGEDAPSLYFGSGSSFYHDQDKDSYTFERKGTEKVAIVTSEPLTYDESEWTVMPTGSFVTTQSDGNGNLTQLDLHPI